MSSVISSLRSCQGSRQLSFGRRLSSIVILLYTCVWAEVRPAEVNRWSLTVDVLACLCKALYACGSIVENGYLKVFVNKY